MALQAGVSAGAFWGLSLQEVSDIIIALSERKKQERKEAAIRAYNLASLMTFAIHSPGEFPEFDEFYNDSSSEPGNSTGWLAIREYMREAAKYNNRKWGEEG